MVIVASSGFDPPLGGLASGSCMVSMRPDLPAHLPVDLPAHVIFGVSSWDGSMGIVSETVGMERGKLGSASPRPVGCLRSQKALDTGSEVGSAGLAPHRAARC